MARFVSYLQIYDYSVVKFVVILTLFSHFTSAQPLEKGIKAYQEKNYEKAIGYFDDVMKADSTVAEAYFRKAQALEAILKFDESLPYYRKALRLNSDLPLLFPAYPKLINAHLQAGEYTKARTYIEKYSSFLKPNSMALKRANRQLETCIYGEKAIVNPLKIAPELLSDTINRFDEVSFPSLTADNETLVFTVFVGRNNEDLYITKKKNGYWSEPLPISTSINSEGNEGASSISGDGNTLVFTACNRHDGYGSCDLYISKRNGDLWETPKNLGGNINTPYRERQPSLSVDGKTLYFISERTGGFGGDDIWYSTLQKNGQWAASKNLGSVINTIYDEASPFIHANGHTLFFASEGHENLGGLDLFMADSTNKWGEPQNLGYPINTSDNQVSMVITADGQYGYYAKGFMNENKAKLFRVVLPESIQQKFKAVNALRGVVVDSKTKKPLQANIELYDLKTSQVISKFESKNTDGQYVAVIPNGDEWGLYVSAEGYYYKSQSFDFTDKHKAEGLTLNIQLDPLNTVNKAVLNNIYFETGKADLQEKSRTELNKLIQFLQANPTVKIEVSGHTDDVGDAKQNQILSQKRAQSVLNYLSSAGVVATRIKAIGYGKTRPVAPNSSDENRRLNRRIEWRVL